MEYNKANHPKLSVIIPCYNQGCFLLEALPNVSNKEEVEVIIVNDGSDEPETIKIINGLDRSKYIVIEQQNKGLSATRNVAIQHAKADYILALDADNIVMPEYYQKAIDILDAEPQTGVVYANPIHFGKESREVTLEPFNLSKILHCNYIDACAIFRKKAWEQTGGYDENMAGYEDWEFWISVYEKGWKFHYLNEFLFKYRVRENSMVTTCIQPEKQRKLLTHIYNKHKALYETHQYDITNYIYTNVSNLAFTIEEQNKKINLLNHELSVLHQKTESMRLKNRVKRLFGL